MLYTFVVLCILFPRIITTSMWCSWIISKFVYYQLKKKYPQQFKTDVLDTSKGKDDTEAKKQL